MSCQELASAKTEQETERPSLVVAECWLDKERICDKRCIAFYDEEHYCIILDKLSTIASCLEDIFPEVS